MPQKRPSWAGTLLRCAELWLCQTDWCHWGVTELYRNSIVSVPNRGGGGWAPIQLPHCTAVKWWSLRWGWERWVKIQFWVERGSIISGGVFSLQRLSVVFAFAFYLISYSFISQNNAQFPLLKQGTALCLLLTLSFLSRFVVWFFCSIVFWHHMSCDSFCYLILIKNRVFWGLHDI